MLDLCGEKDITCEVEVRPATLQVLLVIAEAAFSHWGSSVTLGL